VAAPPAELPPELKLIPPDSAAFVHIDIAALFDSKLGDAVKNSKSSEVAGALTALIRSTGGTLADVKTYTVAFPTLQEQSGFARGLSVITLRKKFDRDKVVAALKAQAKEQKGEFAEKDNLVRITTPSPLVRDNKFVTTYDLSDPTRIVVLSALGDEFLKPSDVVGLHTPALREHSGAAAIAGVNFNALPAELRDQLQSEKLPPAVRPFLPIFLADGLSAVATLGKDRLTVSVRVKSKRKGDAAEVEKSLDALRKLTDDFLTSATKELPKTSAKPKELGEFYAAVQKAMADAKFAVDDSTTTASLSLPLDTPVMPFVEMLAGGGLSGRARTQNNLKQLGLGMYNYENAVGFYPSPATLGKKGKKLHSWRVEILPFIGYEELYKKFKLDEPWDSEHNLKVVKDNPMPEVFAVPGTTNLDDKKTHFQVFVGNGAMFDPAGPTKPQDVKDGTTNTFMVVTAAKAVEWTRPDDIEFDPKAEVAKLLLFKDGITQVGMGDGSVRAISATVSEKTLKAAVTRAGGEVLGDDF
jgi:hypothetical protein